MFPYNSADAGQGSCCRYAVRQRREGSPAGKFQETEHGPCDWLRVRFNWKLRPAGQRRHQQRTELLANVRPGGLWIELAGDTNLLVASRDDCGDD